MNSLKCKIPRVQQASNTDWTCKASVCVSPVQAERQDTSHSSFRMRAHALVAMHCKHAGEPAVLLPGLSLLATTLFV